MAGLVLLNVMVVLALPALTLCNAKFTVTISLGSITPFAGEQFSLAKVVPAGAMEAKKSSLIIVPTAWLLPRFAFTTLLTLTKNVSLLSLRVSPITGTAIVCVAWPAFIVRVPLLAT